ncbi:hypothetical protein [Circovirus-like genome DCCV-7]|uniref:hypothetical protein n=1 Tax=Circovirus-like genome DCCV-7 TaxID=1788447 RepID=UPI0007F98F50|nr:hypothetical protein [Circovirus-like genome DCCV-7]AMB42971.1 hypothetical protein [Circovirus-like genome DCCV-7]
MFNGRTSFGPGNRSERINGLNANMPRSHRRNVLSRNMARLPPEVRQLVFERWHQGVMSRRGRRTADHSLPNRARLTVGARRYSRVRSNRFFPVLRARRRFS